jgi:hypothetical protein
MRINEENDKLSFEELRFKETAGITVNDMTNNFVTEELFTLPLYKKILVDGNIPTYKFFPYNDVRVEGYCNKCKCKRIFCFQNSSLAYISLGGPNAHQDIVRDILKQIDYFTLRAQADCGHKLIMCFWKNDENTIMKIGQNPSIYDMNENINNKSFLKLLDDEYERYYKTACSLYSFNSCIGAMVYLRRIFEKLLIDTFKVNQEKITIDESEFNHKRVDEKVEILKLYLPKVLNEQGFNNVYIKISDGIHNLSEDECQVIFPILKDSIEEILIEKIQLKEKTERISKISKKLMNI